MRSRGWVGLTALALLVAAGAGLWALRDAPDGVETPTPQAPDAADTPTPQAPAPDPTAEAARNFLEAFRAGNVSEQDRIVAELNPDPWRVVEALVVIVSGPLDAAQALAERVPEHSREALTAHLARTALIDTWRAKFPDLYEAERSGAQLARTDADPYLDARIAAHNRNALEGEAAIAPSQKAIALAESIGWLEGLAEAQLEHARLMSALSRTAEMRKAFLAAGEIFNAVGARPIALHCWANAAVGLYKEGRPMAALQYFDFALADPAMEVLDRAEALGNKGVALARLDRIAEATDAYEASIALYDSAGDARNAAIGRSFLAGHYARLGDGRAALAMANEAAKGFAENETTVPYGTLLVNRGMANLIAGEAAAALADFERARAVFTARNHDRLLGSALHHIAFCQMEAGRFDAAEDTMHQAAARAGGLLESASVENNLGHLALRRDRLADAEKHFRKALEQGEQLGSDFIAASALGGMAEAALQDERFDDAIRHCITARSRVPALSLGLPTRLGAHVRSVHARMFDVALCACRASANVETAFQFLESGRARQLVEDLGRLEYQPGRIQVVATYRDRLARLGAVLGQSADAVAAARNEVNKARAALLSDDPSRPLRDVSLARTRKALRAGQVILLFGRARSHCVVGVVRQDAAKFVELCPWSEIEAACRHVPSDGDPDLDAAQRALAPLLARLLEDRDRHVLISPVGALFRVPFGSVLPDRNVTLIPSASVWQHLVQRDAPTRRQAVLAVAGIPRRPGFPSLPESAEAGFAQETLSGRDARPEAVQTSLQRQWQAVHFACHAAIDTRDGFRSGLVLADGADGHLLRMADIVTSRVGSDLVFLSACASGAGEPVAAEGLLGFARAFLSAGADRVIVSLWPVRDRPAAEFARRFYEHWRNGRSASEALRMARKHDVLSDHAWVIWGRHD